MLTERLFTQPALIGADGRAPHGDGSRDRVLTGALGGALSVVMWICAAVLVLSGCTMTGGDQCTATAGTGTQASQALLLDGCPDPLSAYDPSGMPLTFQGSLDPTLIYGGLISPVEEVQTCRALVVGLSTTGGCAMPSEVNLMVGEVRTDGSFIVALAMSLETSAAEDVILAGGMHELHFAIPKPFGGVQLRPGYRPVVAVRSADGLCPVEMAPACGQRAVLIAGAFEGWNVVDTTFVLGVEDCVSD